jgi:hypothetical protein
LTAENGTITLTITGAEYSNIIAGLSLTAGFFCRNEDKEFAKVYFTLMNKLRTQMEESND